MGIPAVRFNVKDRPEFFQELRNRVNSHFKDNNLSKHANVNMKVKTAFMLLLYFTPLVLMLSGVIATFWQMMAMWAIMGLGMSGIGLSIMHDANHKSYSRNQGVNNILGFLLNFLGAWDVNWKIQPNVLHHTFTNIHGYDEDIQKGVMRFSPDQQHKPFFKYQIFYAPFLYGLMTIYWLIAKDFQQVIRYQKKDLLHGQGYTYRKAMLHCTFHKVWYLALTLALPIIILNVAWWQVLLGFLMMQFISGLVLAFIFQPAHVLLETEFYAPDEQLSVENNWAIHQLYTTCNYANKSIFFSWFVGGLNFQIEHHLFPNICHIHYKSISPIVKQTAEEYGVPYLQHRTFFDALKSHFEHLYQLGIGESKKELVVT